MNHNLRKVEAPPIVDFKAQAADVRPGPGLRSFDMTQAVPAFATFDAIRDALCADLRNAELSFYTDVPGLPELRDHIARNHPLGRRISAEQVLVTVGGNHAAYTALTLLFTPGDRNRTISIMPWPSRFSA